MNKESKEDHSYICLHSSFCKSLQQEHVQAKSWNICNVSVNYFTMHD